MRILIASDKFKGSLSADQVGTAIAASLSEVKPEWEVAIHPMADGGDGSLAVLKTPLGLFSETVDTVDPLGRPIRASYLRNDTQAFIELASASGLVLLKEEERNPLLASTYGTGLMAKHAVDQGLKDVYLLLGGSATHDFGLGIITALGGKLLDDGGNSLSPVGGHLGEVAKIILPAKIIQQVQFRALCDVTNPPYGKTGAATVYAPQKGASASQVKTLDAGVEHLCKLIQQQFGITVDKLEGGGAAGAVAAGVVALLGGSLEKGFATLSQLTGLPEKIAAADIVISGEGKLDEQSLQGKVIDGVAQLCREYQKPLYLFVGANELDAASRAALEVKDVFSVMDYASNQKEAMKNTPPYLAEMSRAFARVVESQQ